MSYFEQKGWNSSYKTFLTTKFSEAEPRRCPIWCFSFHSKGDLIKVKHFAQLKSVSFLFFLKGEVRFCSYLKWCSIVPPPPFFCFLKLNDGFPHWILLLPWIEELAFFGARSCLQECFSVFMLIDCHRFFTCQNEGFLLLLLNVWKLAVEDCFLDAY
mgnify:CR=1 FL=1